MEMFNMICILFVLLFLGLILNKNMIESFEESNGWINKSNIKISGGNMGKWIKIMDVSKYSFKRSFSITIDVFPNYHLGLIEMDPSSSPPVPKNAQTGKQILSAVVNKDKPEELLINNIFGKPLFDDIEIETHLNKFYVYLRLNKDFEGEIYDQLAVIYLNGIDLRTDKLYGNNNAKSFKIRDENSPTKSTEVISSNIVSNLRDSIKQSMNDNIRQGGHTSHIESNKVKLKSLAKRLQDSNLSIGRKITTAVNINKELAPIFNTKLNTSGMNGIDAQRLRFPKYFPSTNSCSGWFCKVPGDICGHYKCEHSNYNNCNVKPCWRPMK